MTTSTFSTCKTCLRSLCCTIWLQTFSAWCSVVPTTTRAGRCMILISTCPSRRSSLMGYGDTWRWHIKNTRFQKNLSKRSKLSYIPLLETSSINDPCILCLVLLSVLRRDSHTKRSENGVAGMKFGGGCFENIMVKLVKLDKKPRSWIC